MNNQQGKIQPKFWRWISPLAGRAATYVLQYTFLSLWLWIHSSDFWQHNLPMLQDSYYHSRQALSLLLLNLLVKCMRTNFYRWRRGGRYNASRQPLRIGIISKKPLWIDDESRHLEDQIYPQKTSWLEGKKHPGACLLKIFSKLGWRGCYSKTESQWAHLLLRISFIGGGSTLWTRTSGKMALFRDILQKVSSGNMNYILRGT